MAGHEYTGYNRTNKDQLPLSKLPIPSKPKSDGKLANRMNKIREVLHQRNLNNAIHLAIEASQGRGTLIDYFAEIGRRFGTHTAPIKDTGAMLPFSFEGQPVRVIGQNNEPWWVLADVCEVLEIGNSRQAATRLDAYEKGVITSDTLGGPQKITIINESGLWSLVLTSRKPEAKRFKKWLTAEVIPTIRKTGSYTLTHKRTPQEQPRVLDHSKIEGAFKFGLKVAQSLGLKPKQAAQSDPWMERMKDWLPQRGRVRMCDILSQAIGLTAEEHSVGAKRRAGAIMHVLAWSKIITKVDGKSVRFWVK